MELKVCPFCGNKPNIYKNITLNPNNRSMVPNHDLEISWEIRCKHCGTYRKSPGSTYYNITDDGELKVMPQNYDDQEKEKPSDKRLEVIEIWNKRF